MGEPERDAAEQEREEDRQLSLLTMKALVEYEGETEIVDCANFIAGLARKNDRRPAKVELYLPDEFVCSLKGEPEQRGKLIAVWIPATVLEDLRRLIVSPAEAAAGDLPLIVAP